MVCGAKGGPHGAGVWRRKENILSGGNGMVKSVETDMNLPRETRNPLRVKFKLLTIAYKALHDLAAAYLSFLPNFLLTEIQPYILSFFVWKGLSAFPLDVLFPQNTLPKN